MWKCADGRMEWRWNDCLQTMQWKQWIKLKLLILPCVINCFPDAAAAVRRRESRRATEKLFFCP